jgi:hypothetical protein
VLPFFVKWIVVKLCQRTGGVLVLGFGRRPPFNIVVVDCVWYSKEYGARGRQVQLMVGTHVLEDMIQSLRILRFKWQRTALTCDFNSKAKVLSVNIGNQ